MAAKPDVKHAHGNHDHCGLCGSCFTTGSAYHPCRPEPIDPEILALFILETRSQPARSKPIPVAQENRSTERMKFPDLHLF